MSMNHVVLTGNLTRDAELRATSSSNTSVVNFSIAVNDRRKNATTGEWEDYPNFFDCSLFGARAEKLAEWLTKGRPVAIQGKLRFSQWEKDGQKRSSVSVLVDDIEFMDKQRSAGSSNAGGGDTATYDVPAGDFGGADEDMPF